MERTLHRYCCCCRSHKNDTRTILYFYMQGDGLKTNPYVSARKTRAIYVLFLSKIICLGTLWKIIESAHYLFPLIMSCERY
jgi:hypothetical protein